MADCYRSWISVVVEVGFGEWKLIIKLESTWYPLCNSWNSNLNRSVFKETDAEVNLVLNSHCWCFPFAIDANAVRNVILYISGRFSGLSDWEDAGLLAQVLAASQQEYLDGLKKTQSENHQDPDKCSTNSDPCKEAIATSNNNNNNNNNKTS